MRAIGATEHVGGQMGAEHTREAVWQVWHRVVAGDLELALHTVIPNDCPDAWIPIELHLAKATAHLQMRKIPEGERHVLMALGMALQKGETHQEARAREILAKIYWADCRFSEAIAAQRTAVESCPSDPLRANFIHRLSRWMSHLGLFAQAAEALQHAEQLGVNPETLSISRACDAIALRDFEAASQWLKNTDPSNTAGSSPSRLAPRARACSCAPASSCS
jgi:hypothetical protein